MNIQLLELIFISEKRKDLLLFLREGPKTIAEIKIHLNLSSVAVLPQLKKLRENSLVIKKGDTYSLSPLGIAIVGRMQSILDVLKVFETEYDYWANHAIESIPAPFLQRIGELSNCRLSQPLDRTRLFEPHSEFVENLEKSEKMSGIFSIFHPYISFYINFTKMGRDSSIIVTPQVYEKIKEEFKAELRESFKLENVGLYVCRGEIEISYLVVTDKSLSLSLPFSDGTYDYQRDILCFDPVSLNWGDELFAYYRDISEKVTEI